MRLRAGSNLQSMRRRIRAKDCSCSALEMPSFMLSCSELVILVAMLSFSRVSPGKGMAASLAVPYPEYVRPSLSITNWNTILQDHPDAPGTETAHEISLVPLFHRNKRCSDWAIPGRPGRSWYGYPRSEVTHRTVYSIVDVSQQNRVHLERAEVLMKINKTKPP